MFNLKNIFSKHFVDHVCGTLSDIKLIIASCLLTKADRAGCWLGNTLLAASLCYSRYSKTLCAQGVMGGPLFPFSILTQLY